MATQAKNVIATDTAKLKTWGSSETIESPHKLLVQTLEANLKLHFTDVSLHILWESQQTSMGKVSLAKKIVFICMSCNVIVWAEHLPLEEVRLIGC